MYVGYPRERLGVRSTVIPIDPRGHAGPPGGKYRAQTPARFRPRAGGARHQRVFGPRWQVGPACSRHKRRLGSAPGGKSDAPRERECRLRALAHNLMLLAAAG